MATGTPDRIKLVTICVIAIDDDGHGDDGNEDGARNQPATRS